MDVTGDLVHEGTYALAFRTLLPRPEPPRALLVLLHGVGADERQFAPLGTRVAADTLVVLPRGPRTISGGRLGWFRESLGDGEPQAVEDEAEASRIALAGLLRQLQQRFGIAPGDTIVGGFSQGGTLAASTALTAPALLAGFAVLCGRLMPEIEARLAPAEKLAHLRALIVHGRRDEVLPAHWARRAAERLARLGIEHELHLHDAGHRLAPSMEDQFVRWLGAGRTVP